MKSLEQKIIKEGNFDLIWTNEPVMGLMTRLAAKKTKAKVEKVDLLSLSYLYRRTAPADPVSDGSGC